MTTPDTQLIDEVLPHFDISAVYSIRIKATPERIDQVLREGIPAGVITKILMALRAVPRFLSGKRHDWPTSPQEAFYKLKQLEQRELVIGIIGQFWKPVANLVQVHSLQEFLEFQKDGFCKAALNLRIHPKNSRECLLTTETRILAYGAAKKHFNEYWRAIAPFSGLIRREILRKIKNKAEKKKG